MGGIRRGLAHLACSAIFVSCSVNIPSQTHSPISDGQVQVDSRTSLDARLASEAGTSLPDGGHHVSANRPTSGNPPPCGAEDTCSTVCDWVVQCISDVRTCARPDAAWSQQVTEVCDVACGETGPGLARFYRDSLCHLNECDDLAKVNLRVDAT